MDLAVVLARGQEAAMVLLGVATMMALSANHHKRLANHHWRSANHHWLINVFYFGAMSALGDM